jgi:hypothetical protein
MGVELRVEPQSLAIAPGERGSFTVTLSNPGDAAVHERVTVTGDAADWSWVNPADVEVGAGESATVRVSVRVPPPPNPPAGPVALSVESQPGGGVAAATVQVLPVVDVSASLGRSEGRSWGYPVTVRNKGNVGVVVTLDSDDDGVSVDPFSVAIDPGDLATASVHVRGAKEGTPFRVHVRPDGGAASAVSGTVEKVAGGGGVRRLLKWPVIVPILVVALVGGVVATRSGGGRSTTAADSDIGGANSTVPDDPSCPAQNHLAADPAGLPRRSVPIPSRYALLEVRPGGCLPVRYNPCEPVHYVVNAAQAPTGGVADLQAAFAQLSAATGMTFVNDGPTDEPASDRRPIYQPQRYPNRWAPLLIAWDHGAQFRMEDTNPGGGRSINVGGVYVSGFLILNVDARGITAGFGDGATWGRVMIHELGHMVGLGHVRASTDVMFNELGLQRGRAEFHAGDLEGLELLGKDAGCLTTPPPR